MVMAIPILLYHSIATDPPSPIAAFTVSPKNFAHDLELIVESGRTVLTVSQLVDARTGRARLPERVMVVTFDDGYADFAETAAPALLAQSLPSTLYVTTGMLRDRSRRRVPRRSRPLARRRWRRPGSRNMNRHKRSRVHRQVMRRSFKGLGTS